jgi:hypothetical protein
MIDEGKMPSQEKASYTHTMNLIVHGDEIKIPKEGLGVRVGKTFEAALAAPITHIDKHGKVGKANQIPWTSEEKEPGEAYVVFGDGKKAAQTLQVVPYLGRQIGTPYIIKMRPEFSEGAGEGSAASRRITGSAPRQEPRHPTVQRAERGPRAAAVEPQHEYPSDRSFFGFPPRSRAQELRGQHSDDIGLRAQPGGKQGFLGFRGDGDGPPRHSASTDDRGRREKSSRHSSARSGPGCPVFPFF